MIIYLLTKFLPSHPPAVIDASVLLSRQ